MIKPINFSGTQRVFRGKDLLQISLPLGGIGTGCIGLNGCGGLQDFSIHGAPFTTASPDHDVFQDAGFALLHLPEMKKTCLVEGPFPPEKIYNLGLKSLGYNGGGFEGFPRFRECSFVGEYPFGKAVLKDSSIPIEVEITGFNPFVPLDDIASGIPCAILEYRLINRTENAVPYQFSYHVSHLAFPGKESVSLSARLPKLGVSFWNESDPGDPLFGSAAFGVLEGDPQIKARWLMGSWFDSISELWREVSTGSFVESEGLPRDQGPKPVRNGGSVLIKDTLAAHSSITYPVVITWYFPNIERSTLSGIQKECLHPFYSSLWKDAAEVLKFVQDHYDELRSRTERFHQALFSSSLPAAVLDAVSANLGILKSPTVLRFSDGNLWGWEGCCADKGSCPGSCTHVWNYAQSLPHLFPALERTLRQREFEDSMDERGHINFRAPLPGESASHTFPAAADGQLGGIIKVYREWQISGDRVWLERMYPLVKRSLDYCIEQWDPRHAGLIEEPHHNTYDIEFWGPDGLCSSMYIGALTAMMELAKGSGHTEDAGKYEELADRGVKAIEKLVFHREYYQQKIEFRNLHNSSFLQFLADKKDDDSQEVLLFREEGPKYQVGRGCLSDGVFGACLAALCGLNTKQDQSSIKNHLQSVYRYNFRADLWDHANSQRPGFALGDEAGLLLCSWPYEGKPTLPFVYSDEVWTGVEYQVASHMILSGMVKEGLSLVEAARSRYDGHTRNPWNEYECGSYYARAMASYGLLIAFSGFQYSAVTHRLRIAPKGMALPFTCFYSSASSWGTFTIKQDSLEIFPIEGDLQVNELEIDLEEKKMETHPDSLVRAKKKSVFFYP